MTMTVKQPIPSLGKWSPQGHMTHKTDKEEDHTLGHQPLSFLWGYFGEGELIKWPEKHCWSFMSIRSLIWPPVLCPGHIHRIIRPRPCVSILQLLASDEIMHSYLFDFLRACWCICCDMGCGVALNERDKQCSHPKIKGSSNDSSLSV